MSLSSKIKKIRNALVPLTDNVYHFWRSSKEYPCIIWQEDSESSYLDSNNHKSEQVIHGTVDLYTFTEYDDLADSIQDALDNVVCCAWRLNSAQYEDSTNLFHYEWEFNVE